jgi:hypothetical protein
MAAQIPRNRPCRAEKCSRLNAVCSEDFRRWKNHHPPRANFSFALQTTREIRACMRLSARKNQTGTLATVMRVMPPGVCQRDE